MCNPSPNNTFLPIRSKPKRHHSTMLNHNRQRRRHHVLHTLSILYLTTSNTILTPIAATSVPPYPSSSSSTSNIRSSNTNTNRNTKKPPLTRLDKIRRLYGEENAHVRRELHKLETESTQYWRTGHRGDSSFEVLYHNHPFQSMLRNNSTNTSPSQSSSSRKLKDESESSETTSTNDDTTPSFAPMRITLHTTSLESQATDTNSIAKVNFIRRKILPRMTKFWSQALSVVPVQNNLYIQKSELSNREFCGDSEFTKVPPEHFTNGIPDTDLLLYVSATPSSRFCGPSTLAVAVACNFDQYDRPTAGAINFCLSQVTLDTNGNAHPATIDDNVDVAIHEAAHVLGMSSNSYRYFWDPETGKPRTKRGFVSREVECVDGVRRDVVVPDEGTLVFGVAKNGQRYASIVTKTVRTVARNQFNCQSLEGGQLENQPTGTGSCTGDHWDERMYYPEALSGVISASTNILSPITLALLEDSGWYKANFTKSSVSPWGHGVGCDFVNEPCLINTGSKVEVPDYGRGYFCTKASGRGCSASHDYKMGCTVIDYSLFYSANTPEKRFQYFPGEPTLGGPRQADYCPLYGSTYKSNTYEHDCRDPDNGNGLGLFSEVYGKDSLCFETEGGEGRCYESKCIASDHHVLVKVRGEWHTCKYDFQKIDVKVSDTGLLPVTIICPRLSTVCPDMFCPANCAGRGVCDFDYNVNGTVRAKCNCFNESDTSPGCAETMELDGKYLDNSDGLVSRLERTIFDPLIAVFVDHPSTWTMASWMWASGLFALFLLMVVCICSSCMPSRKRKHRRKRVRRSDDYYGQ